MPELAATIPSSPFPATAVDMAFGLPLAWSIFVRLAWHSGAEDPLTHKSAAKLFYSLAIDGLSRKAAPATHLARLLFASKAGTFCFASGQVSFYIECNPRGRCFGILSIAQAFRVSA